MPSTYSNLKFQLMATGENNATWGTVTNTNLGTAIEEAITGSADVAFSSANVTLTLTDTNTSQTARNLRLNLTGTATAGYNLIVPAIEKAYIVNNGTDGTITVKNSATAGVAVPAGKTMWVFNNGTNVVDVINYLPTLNVGSALTASGTFVVTGATTLSSTLAATGATTLSSTLAVTGSTTLSSTLSVASTGTFVSPNSGTSGAVRLRDAATDPDRAYLQFTNNALSVQYGYVQGLSAKGLAFGADNESMRFNNAGSIGFGVTVLSAGYAGSDRSVNIKNAASVLWQNASNVWNTTTAGGAVTYFTDNNLYIDAKDAGSSIIFRVNGLNTRLTITATGAITSSTVPDAVGYKGIPRSGTSGTIALADVGKCVAVAAGIAVPNNIFVAGDAVSIYNDSAVAITITAGVTTLRLAGTTTTGNRTLAARGMATVWFNSPTEAIISGAGVT